MRNYSQIQFDRLYERWEAYLKMKYPIETRMMNSVQRFWEDEKVRCGHIKVSFEDLKNLLNIRNVRAHSPSFLEIKPSAVQKLKVVVNTFCRKAIEIATPEEKIYSITSDSYVDEVVATMAKNLYTHVPIVDKSGFIGVFSENTLLKLVANNLYKPQLKIKRIKQFLKIAKSTDDYLFLPLNTEFYRVYKLFQDYIDKGKRLGAIFLTENGKPSNQIKGLITAWDLHKAIS